MFRQVVERKARCKRVFVSTGIIKGGPMKGLLAITALTSAIVCGSAVAQVEAPRGSRDATLELTMTLMPTNAKTSAAVTAIIELPKQPSGDAIPNAKGVERRAHGFDRTNRAREDDRGFGEDAAAAARDKREAAGRASHGVSNGTPPAPPELPD